MTFEVSLRLIEVLLGFAIAQQSAEHMMREMDSRAIFALRLMCGVLLMTGIATLPVLLALVMIGLWMLHRFNGPYNGGSDKMTTLVLWCLTAAHLAPTGFWSEMCLAYLGLQLVLSYFVSGQVKITNPAWRNGHALTDVFAFSAYPVAENLRHLAQRPALMRVGSWAVIGFEVLFPLSLLHPFALFGALAVAAGFHFANACLFGLNRFFWAWISAFPALIWLQARIFGFT